MERQGSGSCECDPPWLPVSRESRENQFPCPICRTRSMTLGLKCVHRYRGVFRSRSCFTLLPVPAMHRSGASDNFRLGKQVAGHRRSMIRARFGNQPVSEKRKAKRRSPRMFCACLILITPRLQFCKALARLPRNVPAPSP